MKTKIREYIFQFAKFGGRMEKIIVLMVAHGSPSQAAIAQTQEFCRQFTERCPFPVNLCFLEISKPDLENGLRDAAQLAGDEGKVVVLPLFLGAAGHQKNDLPVALQWARAEYPATEFLSATPFGPHANLISLLDLRIQEALAQVIDPQPKEESIVLVVGRGSSDPDSNSEIARTARLLFENRVYKSVEYAYQAVASPTIAEGVERAVRLGAKQLIVAPDLLFTGWVEQDILVKVSEKAQEYGLPVVTARPLGVHSLLLEVAAACLEQAIKGQTRMSCNICKYRLPMAGYEYQVGKVQGSHHFHPGGHIH
jgi:sirohydrochlorin cobaltochelatase